MICYIETFEDGNYRVEIYIYLLGTTLRFSSDGCERVDTVSY